MDKHRNSQKLTIAGLWGDFIFKPQTERFSLLPENEDLTMHLAELAKIKIVSHSLIRMKDGSLGYITRRIDRSKDGDKIAMEDMCQLNSPFLDEQAKESYKNLLIKRLGAGLV